MNEPKVFISHSSRDRVLVDRFVDLLVTGLGLPNERIFCTSLEGLGIPTGKDFVDVIKSTLYKSDFVIFLISENFYSSRFCLCEMGAAWALASKVFPLIVPPLDYRDVKEVFAGMKLGRIGDGSSLENLKDELVKECHIQLNEPRWNEKKTQFAASIHGMPSAFSAVMRRGDIFNNIVDAALYVPSVFELQEVRTNVIRHIQAGKVIPTTYSYISDSGFWNWIRLCEDPEYLYFQDSLQFFAGRSREIASTTFRNLQATSIDFVSLGPGNGQKDLSLLRAFARETEKKPTDIYYYPLDINPSMVELAVNFICRDKTLCNRLKIKAIVSDFEYIHSFAPVYRYRSVPKVISFLGNTLGNMKEDRDFLTRIYRNALSADDFLVLEVKTIPHSERQDSMGSLDLNRQFDFGPLEILGLAYDPSLHSYTLTTSRSAIPGTRTTIASYRSITYAFRTYDNVILSYVHEYDPKELNNVLDEIGFRTIIRFDEPLFSVFLLQRPG